MVTSDKIQETKTEEHLSCIKKYYNKDFKIDLKQKEYINHNCSKDTLDNLFQELYKRVIVPFYIPLLILTSLFLIIFSKENKFYQRFRFIIFIIGFLIVILSETLLRFIQNDFYYNIKIVIIPFVLFFIFYLLFKILLKKNLGAKT